MDCEANMHDLLACMLHDANLEPTQLPLSFLKAITDNFSDGRQIGIGGFAIVYKGLLRNGTAVAVKKLSQTVEVDEKKFNQEVESLMRVKHKNIVQFLGYCADTQGKVWKFERKSVMAEERQRLLCFEFMPKGSLEKYIKDATQGLDWMTLYNIIKGICEGLHYLHENNIVHLDLKPANILLNDYMVPKIADFGISRCFDENQTWAATSKVYGTLGYMAPEFYNEVITITFKSDIYSLGTIIIEILTGRKGYPDDIDSVLTNWSTRFKNVRDPWLEHVKECVEMGIKCMDLNPQKRPITQHIIDMLVDMEHRYGFNETDFCTSSAGNEGVLSIIPSDPSPSMRHEHVMLDVYPLDIWFPFEPQKTIKCPVTLTNRTDHHIGVCIKPTFADACSNLGYPYVWESKEPTFTKASSKLSYQPFVAPFVLESEEPNEYIEGDDLISSPFIRLGPHSSVIIFMTMRKQQQQPSLQVDKGMFDVVMVATKSEESLGCLFTYWKENMSGDPWGRVEELGSVVHRATLRVAVTTDPTRCQQDVVALQLKKEGSGGEHGRIRSMDVHPTKTWLLVAYHSERNVSIWNYKTQERIIWFEVAYLQEFKYPSEIWSIKFIDGEHWFATGDDNGCVHVYAYTSHAVKDKVKELEAHSNEGGVTTLAVHPKHTWLLTAVFSKDESIKLWDWSQGWTCAQVIDTHGPVYGLMVGPRDTSILVSTGFGNVIKVSDIDSPDATATFEGFGLTIYTDSHRDFLASLSYDHHTTSCNAKIRDLKTKKQVHTLRSEILGWNLANLACHPTLPILAGIMTRAGSKVHQIVLWDVRTYRVVKRVELLAEDCYYLRQMAFDGTKDITSLLVASEKEIFIIKINVPMLLTGC